MRDKTKEKQLRFERISNKICIRCGKNSAIEDKTRCIKCSQKDTEQYHKNKDTIKIKSKQLELKRISEKLCVRCGNKPAVDGIKTCESCSKRTNKYSVECHKNRIAKGKCRQCGKLPFTGCVLCEICYLKRVARVNLGDSSRWEDLKLLFNQQNNKCPYTGRELKLGYNTSLDHINPKSKGGSNETFNLQWTYTEINNMKYNLTHMEFVNTIKEIYLNLELL